MKNQHAVNLGRKGGQATSAAKREASRLNGAKGGRPKMCRSCRSAKASVEVFRVYSAKPVHLCTACADAEGAC